MTVETRFTLWFRKKVDVSRYGTGHMQWTEWGEVYSSSNKEDLEDSAIQFKRINPGREYKVLEAGVKP